MDCREFNGDMNLVTGIARCTRIKDKKGCAECKEMYNKFYCENSDPAICYRIKIYREALKHEVRGDPCSMKWVNDKLKIKKGNAIPMPERISNFYDVVKNNFYSGNLITAEFVESGFINFEDKISYENKVLIEKYIKSITCQNNAYYFWPVVYKNDNDNYENVYGSISAYKYLKMYAIKTPYGAYIFKKIKNDIGDKRFIFLLEGHSRSLLDREKNQGRREDIEDTMQKYPRRGASAHPNFILLPKNFPVLPSYCGGEKIDPLAVIHHEFGHTKFGNKHTGLLEDERKAVLYYENPVRIYNLCHEVYDDQALNIYNLKPGYGIEPRYTYYDSDGKPPDTINIISGCTGGKNYGKAGIYKRQDGNPSKLEWIKKCMNT